MFVPLLDRALVFHLCYKHDDRGIHCRSELSWGETVWVSNPMALSKRSYSTQNHSSSAKEKVLARMEVHFLGREDSE